MAGPSAGPWIYVRVEDTGRGIPPEKLNTIFEAYQQSDAADHPSGAGLGLAISRELARRMGGDLRVHSEVGAGSSFTLLLPIAPSEPIPRERMPNAPSRARVQHTRATPPKPSRERRRVR